jgi:hypothetical protein
MAIRHKSPIKIIRFIKVLFSFWCVMINVVYFAKATPIPIVDTTEYLASAAATYKLGECFPSSTDESNFHCFAKLRSIATGTGSGSGNSRQAKRSTNRATTTSTKYIHNHDDKCYDNEKEECPRWAALGECNVNPNYMLVNCRYSCQTCYDIVDGHGGITQVVPNTEELRQRFVQHIADTAQYIRTIRKQYPNARATCRNNIPECTDRAIQGHCGADTGIASNIREQCSAACRSCV